MDSLYVRLTIDGGAKLLGIKEEQPLIYESICVTLKHTTSYMELKYKTVFDLEFMGIIDSTSVVHLSDIFVN